MRKLRLELKDKPLRPLKKVKPLLITPRRITLIVFILFLILVAWYFYREIGFLTRPPSLEVSQPPADITTTEETFEISGQTESTAYLTVNDKEVYIDREGNFRTKINLSPGLNIIKIQAQNRFGKTNEIIRRIIFAP